MRKNRLHIYSLKKEKQMVKAEYKDKVVTISIKECDAFSAFEEVSALMHALKDSLAGHIVKSAGITREEADDIASLAGKVLPGELTHLHNVEEHRF